MSIETVVIRHKKEKFSKCSLTPLQGRPEILFLVSTNLQYEATDHIVLSVDAPLLSNQDHGTLLLLDATWKLLPQLESCLMGKPIYRSLPRDLITAYPRKSSDGSDPSNGLASVEALYMARLIMGDRDESLLDQYYWKSDFLRLLPSRFKV